MKTTLGYLKIYIIKDYDEQDIKNQLLNSIHRQNAKINVDDVCYCYFMRLPFYGIVNGNKALKRAESAL